jgi:D-beta-D-heptose 7-phosphate kinase/D-beta-D-heptose 1-phosphate adenosyltransferase
MDPNKRHHDTLVTGCFDVLHVGHLELLKYAFSFGYRVVVGVNDDDSVRALKGQGRPVNCLHHRMALISSIKYVGFVFPIFSRNVVETIQRIRPIVWVKGADYTIDTLNQDERAAANDVGTEIRFAPLVPGLSTTAILQRQ